MMHPRRRAAAVAVLIAALSLVAPSTGQAYRLTGAGGHLGYTNPEHLDGTIVIGGQLEFERSDTRLHLMPNLKFWNVNDMSNLNPNFDLFYHFGDQYHTTPYLGGGLGLHVRSTDGGSDTDLGANLIGGLRFPGASNHHWFLEGRYTASDLEQVSLVGGINFNTH